MVEMMRKVTEQSASALKITSFGSDGFTYYSLRTNSWDIVGFRHLPNERIEMRLMHIEDEFLEEDDAFVAERDASPSFAFDVLDCKQFLSFVEQVVLQKNVVSKKEIQHFQRLDASQLRELRYPSIISKTEWYRYTEHRNGIEKEKISVIALPSWNKKYGYYQINSLWFITLDQSHLDNDRFNLITGSKGLGTIVFTREALEEVVSMTRETLCILE